MLQGTELAVWPSAAYQNKSLDVACAWTEFTHPGLSYDEVLVLSHVVKQRERLITEPIVPRGRQSQSYS